MFWDSLYRTVSVDLTPIAWIVDRVGLDVEFLAEIFYKYLHSLDLTVCRKDGFTVSDDADANGPATAIPRVVRDGRPLFLPYFCGLDFTVSPAVAVAQTKMAI